jgi:hypothetical protein
VTCRKRETFRTAGGRAAIGMLDANEVSDWSHIRRQSRGEEG